MALQAPRNSLTVGHCGNPGGLRHRLNLSLRGPRNDDPSRERSINFALRETEIFKPSKAGAIVGSVDREPCADKQRVRGRTAPPVPTTSVVPLIRCADLRCTQVTEARFAPDGQSVPHSRYRRIKWSDQTINEAVARTKCGPPAPSEARSSGSGCFRIHSYRQERLAAF
jgi:hypothetical protein